MVITLTGPNTFALSQALTEIKERFIAAHGAQGVERVDGESLSPNALPSLLQGASIFGSRRLIILLDAAGNKPLWEALANWLGAVPEDTTLVLVQPLPDKRTKTFKALKQADFREFLALSEGQLGAWLQATATELGATLSADAARFLLQRAGSDQLALWHEVQKLVTYQPAITKEAIVELVEPSPQASAFDLLDAALGHKVAEVTTLLGKLGTNEDPYRLFGLLVLQVHTLAIVHHAGSQKSADAIAKEAALHPFVVRKMRPLAQSMGRQRLHTIIDSVALCDTQLKSTGADPWILLQQALYKIATS